ncbi:MAG: ubiquinol-cytochrome C reductase [Leptotrichiaceae bacterium]|nr:ubiquinol-cytochrome C reductase [Leptotrichiaceae bacterium]
MKKLILTGMLVLGVMGIANQRFVEKCEITSKGVYKDGVRYVNCISKATGRHFNFINVDTFTYQDMDKGSSYVIHFKGKGYRNLKILTHDYPLD